MDRRNFLRNSALALGLLVIAPSVALGEKKTGTRLLATSWSPELAQDLRWYHGIDAEEEMKYILREEITREVGSERGTIRKSLVLDPNTFQARYALFFTNDGKNGVENLWGMSLDIEKRK